MKTYRLTRDFGRLRELLIAGNTANLEREVFRQIRVYGWKVAVSVEVAA